MVIWNGLGVLVVVTGFLGFYIADLLFSKITGNEQFVMENGWAGLVAMLTSAALTYGLHLLLRKQKGRVVIDKETGQEETLRPTHSLFFIPVKFWPAVYGVLGIIIAFSGSGE